MNELTHSTKAVASVRDVARMVGLSPARFYQLMHEGVLPLPVYDIVTRRPHFTEEQQEQCIQVRQRNCGINGKPVCFYTRRVSGLTAAPLPRAAPSPARQEQNHSGLIRALKGLGLVATNERVAVAVRTLYPKGIAEVPESDVVRSVFLHLRRQNRTDSVGG